MNNDVQAKIRKVLEECDAWSNDAAWQVQGTWCIKHKALEIVAAVKGVTFEPPTIIESNSLERVSIVVTGQMGERREWSIGECSVQNYKAFGNDRMAAYPWAMAEKRAKDRVILKLVGLHGYAHSEDEADEFKTPAKQEAKKPTDDIQTRLITAINKTASINDLTDLVTNAKYKDAFKGLSEEGQYEVGRAEQAKRDGFLSQAA